MKKSLLVLLPLMTLALVGCRGRGGKSGSSTPSGSQTSQSSSGGGQSSSSGAKTSQGPSTPTTGTSHSGGDFDPNPGAEVDCDSFELDFTDASLKELFPYVGEDKLQFDFDAVCPGFQFNDLRCYQQANSYGTWLMMTNKEKTSKAFISNHTPFKKAITAVEIKTSGSCAAASEYVVTIGSTHYVDGQTSGTKGTGQNATVKATADKSAGNHFFCITASNQEKNSQIVSLKVTLE